MAKYDEVLVYYQSVNKDNTTKVELKVIFENTDDVNAVIDQAIARVSNRVALIKAVSAK